VHTEMAGRWRAEREDKEAEDKELRFSEDHRAEDRALASETAVLTVIRIF
jgi:hypothetical protein